MLPNKTPVYRTSVVAKGKTEVSDIEESYEPLQYEGDPGIEKRKLLFALQKRKSDPVTMYFLWETPTHKYGQCCGEFDTVEQMYDFARTNFPVTFAECRKE
jgi:hypothetical protein